MIKITTLTMTPVRKERIPAHAVYRIFAKDGSLLYVSMSKQPLIRIQMHSSKEWFQDAHKAEVRWHKTKQSALNAEAVAIILDKPIFNLSRPFNLIRKVYFPIASVRTLRKGKPRKMISRQDVMKGSPMVYTVDELKKLIPKNELADAARHCGMSYSSLWRIWEGKQEPRESTLIILKSYVEMIYDAV